MTEKKVTMTEAPSSLNFYGVTAGGWNLQLTLRDTDEFELMDRFVKLVKWLEGKQVKPKQVGRQPEGNGSQNTAALDLPFAESPPPKEEQFFEAAELLHRSGKAWKIKGGKFTEYGVTIWPEILEAAGIMPEELDTNKTYPLNGYTAYYEEITEKGYPKKVSRLAKQSE